MHVRVACVYEAIMHNVMISFIIIFFVHLQGHNYEGCFDDRKVCE